MGKSATLKVRAIFNVPERYAFCIFLSTPLALLPTSFCGVTSKSLDHPPSTSKMMLDRLISYPGYLCFNSHLSGAYFMVFSEVFCALPCAHSDWSRTYVLRWFPSKRTHHRFPMKLGMWMLQDKEILKTCLFSGHNADKYGY